jgi:copper(I)-binding protein
VTTRVPAVTLGAVLLAAACAGDATDDAPARGLLLRDGWARAADSGATGGAYLVLENRDTTPVSITGVSTAAADAAELHETMVHDGVAHMMPHADLAIAPGATLAMAPGGMHLMLVGMRRAVAEGDTVAVVLQFTRGAGAADSLPVRLPVRAP